MKERARMVAKPSRAPRAVPVLVQIGSGTVPLGRHRYRDMGAVRRFAWVRTVLCVVMLAMPACHPDNEWPSDRQDEPPAPDPGVPTEIRSRLVCVFDIDDTLTCASSAEAVSACRDVGARLAINTAQSRSYAASNRAGTGWVDWAKLGFPVSGKAIDLPDGAYLFGMCYPDCSCSEEFGGQPGDCAWCAACTPDCPASYMGKAYGMTRIAKHYGVEDPTCLVLLDDLHSNTDTVALFGFSSYNIGGGCSGWNETGVYDEVKAYLLGERFASCVE